MEEYIEDLLEDSDSALELLDMLDFESDAVERDLSDMLLDDDVLYNQGYLFKQQLEQQKM